MGRLDGLRKGAPVETLDELASRGCKPLALDVCDEGSMRAAVAAIENAEGAVGALVNNAGYMSIERRAQVVKLLGEGNSPN